MTNLRMDSRSWRRRVGALAGTACDTLASGEAAILREALALLRIAPAEQAARFARLPSDMAFERMLAVNATTSAVEALLPADAAYIASRGRDGVCLASVVLDGDDDEIAAESSTVGLAVLAALCGALEHAPARFDRAPFAGEHAEVPHCLH